MAKDKSTSVIMSVYNGSLYLSEQLDSIVEQTQRPDELLIINDCSTDNGKTEKIINEYTEKYNFIKKINNQKNLGWRESFMKGASIASGDIVFFADQDDVWVKNKIEVMTKAMDNSGSNVLISHCCNTDSELNPINDTSNSKSIDRNKYNFNKKYMISKGVGAAMALRKSFIQKYINIYPKNMAHDRFFQIIAILFDNLDYLDETLIYHRKHGNNATGNRTFQVEDRIRTTKVNLLFNQSLLNGPFAKDLSEEKKNIIRKQIIFSNKRANMLESRSLVYWLLMPLYDLSFYPTWRTWFGDFKAIRRIK